MMRRLKIVFLLLLSTILLLSLFVAIIKQQKVDAAVLMDVMPREFPSFTMRYETSKLGEGGKFVTQLHDLTYLDLRHWRVEVLSDSDMPEVKGLWSDYDGSQIRSFDPRTGALTVNKDVPQDGVYLPEQWLSPIYITKLLLRPNVVNHLDSATSKGTLIVTETLPCQETAAMAKTSLKPCQSGTRVAQSEITYRSSDLIPLLIIERLDGIEIARITVTSLSVNAASD